MPSTISNQMYNLTYPTALTFVVGAFTVNPAYCPITYSFVISPAITPSSVVAFAPATQTFTVQSNDLSLAGTYTITISVKSPALAVLSPTLSLQLDLVNPCLAATFTIDTIIIAASATYVLADP